jgi:hypothetical protein
VNLAQPERMLLFRQMTAIKEFVRGAVIDVGGFNNRYKSFLNFDSWVNANLPGVQGADLEIDLTKTHSMESQYDTVICNQVIGDIANPFHGVNELLRLAKPGGHVILTESFFNESHDEPYDFFRFTVHGAKALVEASRIPHEIVYLDRRGGFFSVMAQQVNRLAIEITRPEKRGSLVRAVVGVFLKVMTRLGVGLDGLIKNPAYYKWYLGWIMVVRKTG